jgi:hypothetical protein
MTLPDRLSNPETVLRDIWLIRSPTMPARPGFRELVRHHQPCGGSRRNAIS